MSFILLLKVTILNISVSLVLATPVVAGGISVFNNTYVSEISPSFIYLLAEKHWLSDLCQKVTLAMDTLITWTLHQTGGE